MSNHDHERKTVAVYTTKLYKPGDAEALIAETVECIDLRTAEAAVAYARTLGFGLREGDYTGYEQAIRAWQHYLPGTQNAQVLRVREEWGWTHDEIHTVLGLLTRMETALRDLTREAPLEGTKTSLVRDADQVLRVWRMWASMYARSRADRKLIKPPAQAEA